MHLPGGSLGFPGGSYVVWWASPIGGVFGGLLGWWGVWWGLVGFGLVLEFPRLGGLWHWVSWGFNPWIVPLRFGTGFPRVEALGVFLTTLCCLALWHRIPCGGLAWG